MIPLRRPKGVLVHHSATKDSNSESFEAIKHYHTEVNGWEDIGYHFVIEMVNGEARLFTGRGLQYEGAHCRGLNDHVGICVVGDFDLEEPSTESVALLSMVIQGLLCFYKHMSIKALHYHNEYSNKTCPGTKFPELKTLRFFVEEAMDART